MRKRGVCYIVFYSNGIIKAGCSRDMYKRLNDHITASRKGKVGSDIAQFAFTSEHEDYYLSENVLLNLLSQNCEKRTGEFFVGVDKSFAINAIDSLGFGSRILDIHEIDQIKSLTSDHHLRVKGYSLPPVMHAYLEQVAAQRDSNASRELRQIIRADMARAAEKPKKRA